MKKRRKVLPPTFRQVQCSTWSDRWFGDLSQTAKLLWLYLLTNQRTTPCGCYELNTRLAKFELGLTDAQYDQDMQHLINSERIMYDAQTDEVLIINWTKYNLATRNANMVEAYVNSAECVKSSELRTIVMQDAPDVPTGVMVRKRDQLIQRRNNVRTDETEHARLIEEFGAEFVELLYDKLDKYKEQSGKQYKDDNRAIRKWVIDAVNEDKQRNNRINKNVKGKNDGRSIKDFAEGARSIAENVRID